MGVNFVQSIGKFIWKRSIVKSNYWLTRFLFLRLLGFVYFFAFLSLALQVIPLIGSDGLLPADVFLDAVGSNFDSKLDAFTQLPSIFWIFISDNLLVILAWLGVFLSFLVLIGYANLPLMFILWILYMSFVHVGQLWYSYGWEIQLLETGFLAMFLVPLLDPRPFARSPPAVPVIWLLRWLTFRIHLGSGLIKVRGSKCWEDLSCLYYHYETQPIPVPLSQYLHFLPRVIHELGVWWNHFIELVVPFFIFTPFRNIATVLLLSFQIMLVLSGNLSFLNWVTMVAIVGCFDDRFLKKVMPKFIVRKFEEASRESKVDKRRVIVSWFLLVIVILMSFVVIQNLLSSRQAMNTSYDRLHLVNTYGAFGSIGEVRNELIIEGSMDGVNWKEYEFIAKPGSVDRRLPIIAPYQPRIDWQIWFAAMQTPETNPWLIHLLWKFLHNDEDALSLISNNPFLDSPPKYVRIEYYRYNFEKPSEENIWKREKIRTWFGPISVDSPGLKEFIIANRWKSYD